MSRSDRFWRLALILGAMPWLTGAGPPILWTQLPAGAEVAAGDLPDGTRIVLLDPAAADPNPVVLSRGFTAAGRPALSADGRRVLFVGKRGALDPQDVWEIDLGTRAVRRVMGCAGRCERAIHAASLYTLDTEAPVAVIVVEAAGATLLTALADGSSPRPITFNPLGAAHPLLLRDGRLVYSSGTVGGGAALFAIHVDGTDVFPFTVLPGAATRQILPCQAADGDVYFIEAEPGDDLGGGALVAVPRTGSLTGRRRVTAAPPGRFLSPAPLPDGRLLVAHVAPGGTTYGIARLDPRAPSTLEAIFDAPDRHDIDPAAVAPRAAEAGRSSAVDLAMTTGEIYCLDARRFGVDPPGGPPVAAIELYRADVDGRRLGRVPVEADGSFHVQVPARTPLRLDAVDAAGNVVRAMSSAFWVMPNERRGCIGCHEDRELTPPNRLVQALRRPPHVLEDPSP